MDNNQPQTIFGITRQEINDFVNNYIEVVPGFNFNQYETIKRCHLYLNSRFYDQSLFSGREKIFFNVSKFRKDAAVKMINIDTADIRVFPSNPDSEWATFFLEQELKLWMKDHNLSQKLKTLADECCTYGTVVLKKTKKGAQEQDLRRFFLDPTVRRVNESRFITIKHYMTPIELRKKIKDGWDKKAIEDIIFKKQGSKSFAPQSYENYGVKNPIISTPYIEVYERYGELPAQFFKDPKGDYKKGDPVRSLAIVAEPFLMGRDDSNKLQWDEGNILYLSEWVDEWPFKDFHYSQTRGRWLGIGVIEEMFPLQERFNEMANQKRIAMELSAMHLFQSADATVVDNVLTDLQSGDLIKTKTPGSITPIQNEERNMQAFEFEDKVYNTLADQTTAVNDTIQGKQMPSSTPATNAAIQNTNSTDFFKFKRENFAIFLREFFNEFVLPQVEKEISNEHILRFMGDLDAIQKLDDAHVTVLTNNAVIDEVLKNGRVPSPMEVDMLKMKVMNDMKKKGKNRFVSIASGFYKGMDYEFDIVIDEESQPIATLAQNTFQLLTAIGQNPALLTTPVTKALIYDWAEKIGISPVKLELAEAQASGGQSQQQQGQPQLGQTPQPVSPNPLQSLMQPQNGQPTR